MPDHVEWRFEDSFGGLDRELRPPGDPRRRNREGIQLEIEASLKAGEVGVLRASCWARRL